MHGLKSTPPTSFNPRIVMRAVVKALCLFFAFNVLYGLIDPVKTGRLPTLYNSLYPGRPRFMQFNEFDPYRMIDDHVISSASAETFNIVILGSSEIWGSGTLADETIPLKIDRLGLVAADGRPVRVYNLAHPTPYAFRDLIMLEVTVQQHIPIDLVLISTFDASLSLRYLWVPATRANFSLSMGVLERYNLTSAYSLLDGGQLEAEPPFFLRFWRDRDALMTWLTTQARGVTWSLTRIDFDLDHDHFAPRPGLLEFGNRMALDRVDPPASPEFLYAFKQFSVQTGIPLIILGAPAPFTINEFAPWLQEQTQAIGLPLMDCWQLFLKPSDFEESVHVQRYLHEAYGRVIAKHLSDPSFITAQGLPLELPSGFTRPSESCALYPAS